MHALFDSCTILNQMSELQDAFALTAHVITYLRTSHTYHSKCGPKAQKEANHDPLHGNLGGRHLPTQLPRQDH